MRISGLAAVFSLVVLSACSSENSGGPAAPTAPTPVNKNPVFKISSDGARVPDNNPGPLQTLFLKDGKQIDRSVSRGFNIVQISTTTGEMLQPRASFDTWGSRTYGSDMYAMVDYVSKIPDGTLLLIGVYDEAGMTDWSSPPPNSEYCPPFSNPWTTAALQMFEKLGATELRKYCWRYSYAFITIKGVGSQAEQVTNGVAAVAEYTLHLP